jgi:5'-nucleotidase
MRSIGFLAAAALFACACGGNNENHNQQDAGVQDDAAHQWDVNRPQQDATPQQDTGPVTCLVSADYGTLGDLGGYVSDGADITDSAAYVAALNNATKPDLIWFELYDGYGVFANGIKPGTYQLTGDELGYDTCGLCVTYTADYDLDNGSWLQDYMATGGTVVIEEVTPRFKGSFSNLTFARADIDGSTGATTLFDDCTSAIGGGTFDAWFGATATFKIIGLTDFHGQLDPTGTTQKGGAAALSAYVASERNSCTLVVGAGDMVGASPPLSSFFNEEPTIKALNLMGLDVSALGNHEFDKGLTALNSLIALAEFDYTSANLTNLSTNLTGVAAPYVIYDFLDVKVAVIGITDTDLAAVTLPANLGTITVNDQAATIAAVQAARTAAATAGATVFIGAFHAGADTATTGQVFTIANGLTGFDAFIGGHTHYADLNALTTTGNIPIVQPAGQGQSYARISLTVDTTSGAVTARTAEIVPALTASVTPDPAVVTLLDGYRTQLSPLLDGVIGQATATFPRDGATERKAEAPLGNLVADALRVTYSTQLALVNSGGLRAPLPSSYVPQTGTPVRPPAAAPWDLVKGDIYQLLPFGNMAVTRTVTGAQLWAMLENGFGQYPTAAGRFPQISGFKVVVKESGAPGARVQSVKLLDNTDIPNDATTFTLATIDYVNQGGDGYTVLNDGTGVQQALMPEVVIAYIDAQNTITPATDGRISFIP